MMTAKEMDRVRFFSVNEGDRISGFQDFFGKKYPNVGDGE